MHSYLGAVLLWVLPWARLSRWSNRGTCHRIIHNCVNTLLECNYNNLFESPNLSTTVREYQNRNDFIQTYPNLYPNISKPIRTFPNLAKLSQTYPNLFEPFQTYPNIAELIQACQVKARKINFCKLYKWIYSHRHTSKVVEWMEDTSVDRVTRTFFLSIIGTWVPLWFSDTLLSKTFLQTTLNHICMYLTLFPKKVLLQTPLK